MALCRPTGGGRHRRHAQRTRATRRRVGGCGGTAAAALARPAGGARGPSPPLSPPPPLPRGDVCAASARSATDAAARGHTTRGRGTTPAWPQRGLGGGLRRRWLPWWRTRPRRPTAVAGGGGRAGASPACVLSTLWRGSCTRRWGSCVDSGAQRGAAAGAWRQRGRASRTMINTPPPSRHAPAACGGRGAGGGADARLTRQRRPHHRARTGAATPPPRAQLSRPQTYPPPATRRPPTLPPRADRGGAPRRLHVNNALT